MRRTLVAIAGACVVGAGALSLAVPAAAAQPQPPKKVTFHYADTVKDNARVGYTFTATWPAGAGGGATVTGYRVGIATIDHFNGMGAVWGKPKWITVGPDVRKYVWTQTTAPKGSYDVCGAAQDWRVTVVTLTKSGKSAPAVSKGDGPHRGGC